MGVDVATRLGPQAVNNWCSLGRLDMLLASGADVNAFGRGCEAALHIVARRLRGLWEVGCSGGSPRNVISRGGDMTERARPLPDAMSREYTLLQDVWHNLVTRGADASLPDGQGRTPIERLSRNQAGQLLSAKRKQYGAQRYKTKTSSLSSSRTALSASFQRSAQDQSMISIRRPSSARYSR